jgi:hypothetical protein
LSNAYELAIGILHADYLTAFAALMCPNSFWVKVAYRTDISIVVVVILVAIPVI